jgi:hypothetical protein
VQKYEHSGKIGISENCYSRLGLVGETRILMTILNLLITGEKDQQEGGQNLLASSPPLTSGSFLSLASSQGKDASKT